MFEIFHCQCLGFGGVYLKFWISNWKHPSALGTGFRQAGVRFEALTNSTTLHVTLQDGMRDAQLEKETFSWHILGDRLIPLVPLSLVGFYM